MNRPDDSMGSISYTSAQTPGITDFHSHFLTDEYVHRARRAGVERPDGMPGWPAWTVTEHLELMHRHGIGHAVLSISSPGVHFGSDKDAVELARHVNDEAARHAATNPGEFSFLASLPLPAVEASVTEARRSIEQLGARGVVMMSNVGGIYLGDDRLAPVFEALDEMEAVVLVHPTSPPGWQLVAADRPRPMLEFMFETTRTVTDMIFAGVLLRCPRLRLVIPHFGSALCLLSGRIERFRSAGSTEATPTTLEQLRLCWFDTAGVPGPHQVSALVNAVGAERLVYGSDFCWTPSESVARSVSNLDATLGPMTAAGWRELIGANSEQLLRR